MPRSVKEECSMQVIPQAGQGVAESNRGGAICPTLTSARQEIYYFEGVWIR